MSRLVCVGDIMQDVSAVIGSPIYWGSDTMATVRSQGGGSPANVASWAAHSGFPTLMIGRVGQDIAGENMVRELQAVGVETHIVKDPEHHTGMVVLLVDGAGERTMFPDPGANQFLDFGDFPPLLPTDVLFITGYAFLYPVTKVATQELVAHAKSLGITIAIDPASAGYITNGDHDDSVKAMLDSADMIIANEDEARVLTGLSDNWEACKALADRGLIAVVKLGARGAIAMDGDQTFTQAADEVPLVVDTTGAGDSFAGGFLAAWAGGAGLQEALEAGVKTAATCVGRIGARP